MVREARGQLGACEYPFKFGVVDAQAIPFAGGRFDAVVANHMLYHVPDRHKALSELHRVLKPGGRLYASTVGRTHLQEMGDLVRRFDSAAASEFANVSNPFVLENGHDQIRSWFSDVSLHRYEDALVVTQAEPLIAYILSGFAKDLLVGDRREPFARFVRQELASRGSIYITKDSGLFEAHKP
jgi:SAM-dependent methyltransferase